MTEEMNILVFGVVDNVAVWGEYGAKMEQGREGGESMAVQMVVGNGQTQQVWNLEFSTIRIFEKFHICGVWSRPSSVTHISQTAVIGIVDIPYTRMFDREPFLTQLAQPV